MLLLGAFKSAIIVIYDVKVDFLSIFHEKPHDGITLTLHKKRQKSNFWDTKTDSKSPTHELSIDILLEKI